MDVVVVENLVKTYEKNHVKAVKGISFEVGQGEIFGLLGPNGAGKSTTFKMLTTLVQPTDGMIRILGKTAQHEQQAIRQEIGYVAQSGGLDGVLTAYENLRWLAKLYRIPRHLIEERIETVLSYVDLTDVQGRPVLTYSGGMRRRLEIASALLHEPKVIFLDEPSVGLDIEHRLQLWDVMKRLREEQGITIFLTTHYLDEADKLCDRVMIIDQGRCVCIGNPQELKDQVGGDQVSLTFAEKAGGLRRREEMGHVESAGHHREAVGQYAATGEEGEERAYQHGSSSYLFNVAELRTALAIYLPHIHVHQINIEENGRHIRFWVDHGPQVVASLIEFFNTRGETVESVRISQPTLDDVMIQHTQRSMQA